MDADVAEVGAQARVHKSPRVLVERRATARADHVLDEGRLLLLERCAHGRVPCSLLEMHNRGRRQGIGAAGHEGFGPPRVRLVLAERGRLAAIGIDEKVVFVRLHIPASVEITRLPKGAKGPFPHQTPNHHRGQRSTAQVSGHARLPKRASNYRSPQEADKPLLLDGVLDFLRYSVRHYLAELGRLGRNRPDKTLTLLWVF